MPAEVALFVTCIVDQLFPDVGMAMADVLERAGLIRRQPGVARSVEVLIFPELLPVLH